MDEKRQFNTASTFNTPLYSSNLSRQILEDKNRLMSSGNFTMSLGKETETEQEAINMIKSQNRKIQELYEELNKKDNIIESLKMQMNSSENYKLQMENFKRQNGILEDKLRLYETDFSSKSTFLSEQLKHVSEAEAKMRNQIINKDKIIHELDNVIKDQEKQINTFKKQLLDKDGVYSELKQDFQEITAKFKNLTLKLNAKEEEYRKIKEEQDLKISDLSREKILLEEKLAQLIDIVKQYSKEMSEYNVQIQAMEAERRSFQKVNSNMNEEIEELIAINKDLQNQLSEMKETKGKLYDAEGLIERLEKAVENEKMKNEKLKRNVEEINDKYQNMKEKYSGENSIENLKNAINIRENEIESLRQTVENLTKTNKLADNKILGLENELKEILNGLNNEIKAFVQWIETYLVVFYDQNFEIPDLPLTISKSIKNKTKIDLLKETLQKSRLQINGELNKYEQIIREMKKESNDSVTKQDRFIRDVSELKNQILNKNEEIYSLHSELDSLHNTLNQYKEDINKIKNDSNDKQDQFNRFLEKIYQSTQTELEEVLQNDTLKHFYDYVYRSNYSDNLKSQVEDNVDKLIQVLSGLVREFESAQIKQEDSTQWKNDVEKFRREMSEKIKVYKEEIENFKREKEETIKNFERMKVEDLRQNESNFNKSVEKMRIKFEEKEERITQLQQENNLLKSQLDIMEKNMLSVNKDQDLKERFEKSNESFKMLEKKCRNLSTEIDLKDMQIKSQEQMIARRTQELNEMKSKLSNSTAEIYDKEKIKTLETDKEKLLKDNLALMNSNFVLNNQINLLKAQLSQKR